MQVNIDANSNPSSSGASKCPSVERKRSSRLRTTSSTKKFELKSLSRRGQRKRKVYSTKICHSTIGSRCIKGTKGIKSTKDIRGSKRSSRGKRGSRNTIGLPYDLRKPLIQASCGELDLEESASKHVAPPVFTNKRKRQADSIADCCRSCKRRCFRQEDAETSGINNFTEVLSRTANKNMSKIETKKTTRRLALSSYVTDNTEADESTHSDKESSTSKSQDTEQSIPLYSNKSTCTLQGDIDSNNTSEKVKRQSHKATWIGCPSYMHNAIKPSQLHKSTSTLEYRMYPSLLTAMKISREISHANKATSTTSITGKINEAVESYPSYIIIGNNESGESTKPLYLNKETSTRSLNIIDTNDHKQVTNKATSTCSSIKYISDKSHTNKATSTLPCSDVCYPSCISNTNTKKVETDQNKSTLVLNNNNNANAAQTNESKLVIPIFQSSCFSSSASDAHVNIREKNIFEQPQFANVQKNEAGPKPTQAPMDTFLESIDGAIKIGGKDSDVDMEEKKPAPQKQFFNFPGIQFPPKKESDNRMVDTANQTHSVKPENCNIPYNLKYMLTGPKTASNVAVQNRETDSTMTEYSNNTPSCTRKQNEFSEVMEKSPNVATINSTPAIAMFSVSTTPPEKIFSLMLGKINKRKMKNRAKRQHDEPGLPFQNKSQNLHIANSFPTPNNFVANYYSPQANAKPSPSFSATTNHVTFHPPYQIPGYQHPAPINSNPTKELASLKFSSTSSDIAKPATLPDTNQKDQFINAPSTCPAPSVSTATQQCPQTNNSNNRLLKAPSNYCFPDPRHIATLPLHINDAIYILFATVECNGTLHNFVNDLSLQILGCKLPSNEKNINIDQWNHHIYWLAIHLGEKRFKQLYQTYGPYILENLRQQHGKEPEDSMDTSEDETSGSEIFIYHCMTCADEQGYSLEEMRWAAYQSKTDTHQ